MRVKGIGILLILLFVLGFTAQAQGGVLNYGDNTVGELTAAAPLNFYTFSGTEGDRVTIVVIGITPGMDPAVSLLSTNQQQIALNDNDPTSPGSTDARITRTLTQTGTHTILVSSASGTPGDYLIRLFGQPAAETTDVSDTGSVTTVSGTTQVFSFNANPDDPLALSVTTTTPGFSFLVRTFDPTGQAFAVSSGSDVLGVTQNVPPGTDIYTAEVSPVDPNVQGDVEVRVAAVGAPAEVETPPPPATTEEPDIPETLCTVNASGGTPVNVRSGPGTDYDVLVSLSQDDSAAVTGIYSGWYRLDVPNIGEGWVFADVVTTSGDCDAIPEVPENELPGATPEVEPEQATPTYTATTDQQPVQATPTDTATTDQQPIQATPTDTATADQQPAQATPTYTATTAQQQQATATFTATAAQEQEQPTATTAQEQPPTATFTPSYTPTLTEQPPTATFTPSYTPTTPPPPQVAPDDARFNSPLNIPLDSTVSVTDFVSYPGGDTEDRVRWDITGMNPNAALSGGRARLIIAVSCFGQNTDQIEFFTGGQTYSCGQTIVDEEVTYDSRTGQVTITAVGGEGTYVQWVLTGTATRVN